MGSAFNTSQALSEIARSAQPLSFISPGEYDPLIEAIGDARLVLIGEASHGTHAFYRERARITRRLIEEKGFSAVAIEGDWPDAYRVHRFVTGQVDDSGQPQQPIDALSAIGVIYRPETERASHYFRAQLPEQFDAVIHIDRTLALIPLETSVPWHAGEEVPETFPSAV